MPLVSAANDEDFVVEVTQVTAEAEERQRRHTAAMIEEYLRRRTHAVEQEAQEAIAREVERLGNERSVVEAAHSAALATVSRMSSRFGDAAAALAASRESKSRQNTFGLWRSFVERRRGQRRHAEVLEGKEQLRLRFHAYASWRLLAAARRSWRQQREGEKAAQHTQDEQRLTVEQLQDQLLEEQKRNERLEVELKSAFLKGVSALNREAVHVLRGQDGTQDAAEIEEILSGSRHSTAVSPTSQHKQNKEVGSADALLPDGVCPVHHCDDAGTYYHPCYAPCSCPHAHRANHCVTSATDSVAHHTGCPHTNPSATVVDSSAASSRSSQHTPFVVRVDPMASRTFDTEYPRQQGGQKPRWR